MKESFSFVKVKIVTISSSHQRQSFWYCHNIILPLQDGSLISIRLMIRTRPRASAEVFVIQPKNDVFNRLVHQVGGHLAATADLFSQKASVPNTHIFTNLLI